MPKKKQLPAVISTLFDDPKLVRLEERIATHRFNTITEILEIGKLLSMAHEVLSEKGRNSKFGAWVMERCGFSRRTALRYLRAFALFGDHPQIRGHVSWGAIEYLSGDKIPEEAPALVIEEAKKGHIVWEPEAKAIVKSIYVSADEETTSEIVPDLPNLEDEGAEEAEYEEKVEEEEYEDDLTVEEIVKDHNKMIESYCRSLMKQAKDSRPDVRWLDHKGRWDGAIRKIKQAMDTIRSAKCVICPHCEGSGCGECENLGYLPKVEAESGK